MSKWLRLSRGAAGVLTLVAVPMAIAQQLTVDIDRITESGVGEKIGTVTISDGAGGTSFKVVVSKLPPGMHGFHLHEKGNCGPGQKDGKQQAGLAAGGHYDPEGTKAHRGPTGAGHKGDLPALTAGKDGKVNQTVMAPRLKRSDVVGRALVIHEGGDTYSDQPELGGGKGRIACGVVRGK